MPASHNRIVAACRPAALVVIFCLCGCLRDKPSPSDREMRSALADLAGAEDVYYATNLRYSADQSTIVSLTLPRGVTLSIESADEHGWRASASHEFGIETCSESGRNDGNVALAVVEGPTCKPVLLSATQRDVRGRNVVASAPVDPPAQTAGDPKAAAGAVTSAAPSVGAMSTQPAGEISVLLPVIGTQTEDFGYPAQTIDRLAVRRLLIGGSYDALDHLLAAYADSVLRDYRVETRLFDAYAAFDVAIPSLEPRLNEWVHQRPASAAALLARGTFFMASGWHERGENLARNTGDQQFQRMGGFFQRSAADFSAALRLAPNSIVAYRQMMVLARSLGDVRASRNFLDKGLKIQPYSFELRAAHMRGLLPRWGGSYEAMARLAEESAPYANRNPRIKALRGFVDWDKGRVFERAGKMGDAIESYQRAIDFGDFWQFRYERGSYFSSADKLEDALEDFNSVLVQFPQDDVALNERARVEYELGRFTSGEASAAYYSQAFRDIELATALDPTNEDYQQQLAFFRANIPEFTPPASE
jgi:tetratricopeptide (TPR) repeat protein